MNRTKLKNYAPQARRDFIQAMTDRAANFGLTATKIESAVEKGDVVVIGGRSFPRAIAKRRKALEDRIRAHDFDPTMEAMAYTWFNRLVAIRCMELHGYLDHGYRVLSHPEGKPTPEILEHAEHVDLPGLKKEAVIDLKLAGNKENELYRLLLTAQCNALHSAMPFLFEKIDDETELLLPDNLLHSDSLIRKLVNEIDEEDWQEVEIIGWLYQFYISEKKEEVIGKVVASEDIPAATQLFTPNWIVKYLVQNTLGRQWLATYPQSALRQQMPYYIEPAEQTPEVQEQLKAITPSSLNPEELTLLDPACGSGHILVEAYDLFKAIYQERGYRAKDIPDLILNKNLFGLEIDDRAAQLAAFALMMKARADDRRIFDSEAKPNIVAIHDSKGLNAADITHALNSPINKEKVPREYLFEEIQEEKDGLFSKKALAEKGHVSQADITYLLELFENAKTFGSLIQVPSKLASKLPEMEKRLDDVLKFGDLTHASAHVIKPLLQQAWLLARQYDAVVANPPYLGSQNINHDLKKFAASGFPLGKSDLYAMFTIRSFDMASRRAFIGLMTPFTWMFIKSYSALRNTLLQKTTLLSLVRPEYHAFFESAFVPICAFVLRAGAISDFVGSFINLGQFYGADLQPQKTREAITNPSCGWFFKSSEREFRRIPGSPIVFGVSNRVRATFELPDLKSVAELRAGITTGNNAKFVRYWYEVSRSSFAPRMSSAAELWKDTARKWVPLKSGGDFRKWYGNNEKVIRYDAIAYKELKATGNHCASEDRYFQESLTWSAIGATDRFGVRMCDEGFVFTTGSHSIFATDAPLKMVAAYLCSSVASYLAQLINPTLNANPGDIARLPFPAESGLLSSTVKIAETCIYIAKGDWDSFEVSWDFGSLPLLQDRATTIQNSVAALESFQRRQIDQMKELEEENNRLIIEAYGLQGELSPEVPEDQITLYRPDWQEDIKRLLSYAIGCMMGRYSLDKPGLIYAHSGNQGFDPSQYKSFRADDDGIIPLLETDWGIRDDATNRLVEFIGVAWPKEHLEENLKFVADSLGANNGEQPLETIRRALATGFYKHHLSMYKKRPIYWLFSSGKLRAFQCLVYLHRYHEGTLARMRNEYVVPLQGKITAAIEKLEGDKAKATSTSLRNKLQKAQDKLKKQQVELAAFEENLKHAADQKIAIDLDDGVKVNYAKFGDLLAESKAITGGKDDE